MMYEVRRNGRAVMGTDYESCRYTPEVEAQLQAAGYEIYINGKRLTKRAVRERKGDRK